MSNVAAVVQSNIPMFLQTRRRQIAGALNETVTFATLRAQQLAPVDTGHMKNTMQAKYSDETALKAAFGNWTAGYTLWVEIGTARMPARPFMSTAAFEEFQKFPERIKRAWGLGGRFRMPTIATGIRRG